MEPANEKSAETVHKWYLLCYVMRKQPKLLTNIEENMLPEREGGGIKLFNDGLGEGIRQVKLIYI